MRTLCMRISSGMQAHTVSLRPGDTACSSAAHSLHDALADITAGRTDYAVVLGSCHMLAPNMTLAFNRLHMLSPEGACKAFDAAGNGCAAPCVSGGHEATLLAFGC